MDKRESKTPQIRFPEFTDGWEHKQLNELLKVSKKKNKDLKYSKEEVLSVSGEEGIVNQIEHMGRSYAGASVHNYGVVEKGDIVYTKSPLKSNPYGIIKMNKGVPGIVSTLYAIYKVNDKEADGEFIEHYFSLDANTNRYLRPLVRKGAKNDMKINNEYVLHDRIFVPNLKEQKRIAKFLNSLDKKLNQLNDKKSLLNLYKKNLIQNMLSQKIRFENSKGKNFPDWESDQIQNLVEINPKKIDLPSEFIYIDLESVTNGILIKNEKISKKNAPSRAQRYLKPKDILFQMVRPYQRNNYFFDLDISNESYVASTGYAQIRTKDTPLFFYYLMHTDAFVKKVIVRCTGTGYPAINSKDLAKIQVSIPCSEERILIEDFLKRIDSKIFSVSHYIERINLYKNSILQQMSCY